MAQQPELIDLLFVRLGEFYGARFADMWRDSDMARVKATWSRELAEATPDQIRTALRYCLERHAFPPTLGEFVQLIAQSRKASPAVSLPHRVIRDAATEAARDECMQLLANMHFAKPGREWAHRLHQRHQRGEHLSTIQVAMYQRALGLDQSEAA